MVYKYNELLNDLKSGREIEFSYNEDNYSITNNAIGWQFCCNNNKLLFATNIRELIKLLEKYKINNKILIKHIFNNSKYEKDKLYIL